ncbi:hypothetical protein LTR94_028463, partial [Friedmanniomyces endolithicus]
KLDFDGRPITGLPRRTRVQARQVYVFAEAASLGWIEGEALARRGLEVLIRDNQRDDGLWVSATDDAGAVTDPTPDLYDMAFVLFALAAAHRVLGDPRARPLALETLAAIDASMAAPHGGWNEALPARLPRRQNPHMHMLEAMLAWQATEPDPLFAVVARKALALRRERFWVDGAIREYFTEDWAAHPELGHVIEPGHLEEWAWLLLQAQKLGLEPGAEVQALALHRRAIEQGTLNGFMIREMDLSGAPIDAGRRLWGQTEALRTALAFCDAETGAWVARLFQTHLAAPTPGLWIDSYDADGVSRDASAP